jgi:hypothetical protein
MIARPDATEYAPFYAGYVAAIPEGQDVLELLNRQLTEVTALAGTVPPDRETFRYAPGKWSLREVFGHLQDAERVIGYRAFCISRDESTPMPGFDEQLFVARSDYDARPLASIVREWGTARASNLDVLRHFDAQTWNRSGIANALPVSVRALAWILAGHVEHHRRVLRDRYDVGLPGERKGES